MGRFRSETILKRRGDALRFQIDVDGVRLRTSISRSIASCGTATVRMPFLNALPEKMSEKLGDDHLRPCR